MAELKSLIVNGVTRLNNTSYATDLYANKFIKNSSSDSYVLLGGGGHKLISDFALASHTHGNYVTLDTSQTITGLKTFTNYLHVNLTGTNITTPGSLTTVFYVQSKRNNLTYASPIISVLGTNETTNPYNADFRFGSTTGATWISAGESGATLSASLPIYNSEHVWITADSEVKFYVGCSNEGTSYTYAANITTAGVNSIGFIKNGSNNNYILLGGGGHKLITDFSLASHSHTWDSITGKPNLIIVNSGTYRAFANAAAAALADNTAGFSQWAFGEARNTGRAYFGILKPAASTTGISAHGTIVAWGTGDTHLGIAGDYGSSNVHVFGGNADKIVWRKQISFSDHTHSNYAVGAINSGTTPRLAYYSGATAISNTANITYIPNTAITVNSVTVNQNGLRIYGTTYGNDPNYIIAKSNYFSYGDGGPQIQFSTSVGGNQDGALIYTDHDTMGAGASFHFVTNQSDWNVNSKRFVARTSVTIGANVPNTSYALYVAGAGYTTSTLTASGFVKIGSSDSYFLLGGGGHRAVSDFAVTSHTHSNYVLKTGDTMTGPLTMAGKDVVLSTTSSSSNDSGDLTWTYGNGSEKMRIWSQDTPTAAAGPNYRIYNSSGTSLYSGTLVTAAGHGATGTWGISITGNADTVDGYHVIENAIYSNSYSLTGSGTWYFSMTTADWSRDDTIIKLATVGNNQSGYTYLHVGNREGSGFWGYNTTYNHRHVTGLGKVVSNGMIVYVRVESCTGVTIYSSKPLTVTAGSFSGNITYTIQDNSFFVFRNLYTLGVIKNGSSNDYVLLGAGGHTTLSSLGSSHSHSNYVTLDTAQQITGDKSFVGTFTIRYSMDTSNAKGISWRKTDNSTVLQSILAHNTANRIIINPVGSTDAWSDAVGKYNLIIGSNELKYNTYNVGICNSVLQTNLNADLLDGYHAASFSLTSHSHNYINSLGNLNPQTGRTQAYGNVYSYNTNASAYTGAPTTYTSVIGFGRGTAGTVEIAGCWTNGMGLWYRALRDTIDNWYAWVKVIDANNIGSYLSGYSPTNHTHSNYVTLDTSQTITGQKTFTKYLYVDISGTNITTPGSLTTVLYVKDKRNNLTYTSPVISVIGTNEGANAYNADYRFGSTTGATWISAGESGQTLSASLAIYNTEHVWITADGEIKFYVGCNNEGTAYTYAANITTAGVNSIAFKKNGSSDSYVLLGGGGHIALSSLGSSHTHNYVAKTGDTMTGHLTMAGKDLILGTTGAGSNDSGDLMWSFGNGNEKMRIWSPDTPTYAVGPSYRIYHSSNGSLLYSGTLVTAAGHGATGTWGISITGDANTVDGYHANGLFTQFDASANLTRITIGGTTKTCTIPYASSSGNADTVDGLHASSFSQTSHTHSNYVTLTTTQTISGVKNFTNTIRIVGTIPTPAWNTPARIEFAENDTSSQAVSLVYTSYDSYRATAGIKLLGNQGGEWFESPMFVKTGSSASQLLRGDGGVATFNWTAQGGQPTYVWGGNNQHTYYIYNPSNFNVSNSDKVDGFHITENTIYSNSYSITDGSTGTWYFSMKTADWINDDTIIKLATKGNNQSGYTYLHVGNREGSGFWGYNTTYNHRHVTGLGKVVSNGMIVYVRVEQCTSLTIFSSKPLTVTKGSFSANITYAIQDSFFVYRNLYTLGVVKNGSSNNSVLLGGGGDALLSSLGSTHTHSNYVVKTGDTMTGPLTMAGKDVVLSTTGSSSNDSGDLTWTYGNGNEKMRIWSQDTPTAAAGPNYRIYNSSGTSLYSGTLVTAAGHGATGTWGISITGNAASATNLYMTSSGASGWSSGNRSFVICNTLPSTKNANTVYFVV